MRRPIGDDSRAILAGQEADAATLLDQQYAEEYSAWLDNLPAGFPEAEPVAVQAGEGGGTDEYPF